MAKRKCEQASVSEQVAPVAKFRAPPVATTFLLTGKVFVISGASHGIGAAVARHCKRQGAAGLLLIDRDEDAGRALCGELSDAQCKVVFATADLADPEQCKRAMSAAEEFGRLDGLVNSAGVTTRGSLVDTTSDKWDAVINVNLRSAFLLTQAVTELIRRKGRPGHGGSIVNISSVHGHGGGTGMLPYAVSKAGMIAMTKNNASELLDVGIRVNVVNVGWTVTDTEDKFQRATAGQHWVQEAEKAYPLGRLLQPEDVATSVGFLLSDASALMTGTEVDLHPELVVGCLPRQFGNN